MVRYIYDSTMNRPPASGQIGVNDLASSSLSCGKAGTTERLLCFDYGLASGYAYGTIPSFRSARLWDPADPDSSQLKAIITKWVTFFKAYRSLFVSSHLVHIQRPDSRGFEAVAYVRPSATKGDSLRGILSLFNPTNESMTVSVTVPLYFSGLPPASTVTLSKLPISTAPASRVLQALDQIAQNCTHSVGQDGAGLYDIVIQAVLPARSYAIYTLTAP